MRHLRLVSRMARSTRTDLVAALNTGEMTQPEWADMVQTCRRCIRADRCPDWLDENPVAEAAPVFCLNRGQFESLATRTLQTEAEGV
jgi:hypothetical protein